MDCMEINPPFPIQGVNVDSWMTVTRGCCVVFCIDYQQDSSGCQQCACPILSQDKKWGITSGQEHQVQSTILRH